MVDIDVLMLLHFSLFLLMCGGVSRFCKAAEAVTSFDQLKLYVST
jgi:hypothetical protein